MTAIDAALLSVMVLIGSYAGGWLGTWLADKHNARDNARK